MSKIDGGLWEVMRPRFMHWHCQRIETGEIGPGVPDVNMCSKSGRECWVELKQTDGWTPAIRVGQVGWLERRARYNGRVFLLTRRRTTAGPRKGPAVDDLYLHRGGDVRKIVLGGLQAAEPLLHTSGGPAGWQWDLLESLLENA